MKAIVLAAGRGSRLGELTTGRPKCLVDIGGRAILDRQLRALHLSGIRDVLVVGGFQFDALEMHVAALPADERPELLLNPEWASASSIRSVWEARAVLGGPFCVINGDTLFDHDLIAGALGQLRTGLNLLVECAPPEPDDMRVEAEGERIVAVGKNLPAAATMRSLGIVMCPDADGGPYRAALDAVIAEPGGDQRFHHAVIHRLAGDGLAHALPIADGHWREIDDADDIARWLRDDATLTERKAVA